MDTPENIKYKYVKLSTEQFATFEENFTQGDAVDMNNSISFSFDFEKNAFCCSEEISFLQKEKIIIKICVNSYFLIHPDNVADMTEGKSIHFPKNILWQFASLNYGSMRGILFEKTQGSVLNNIILPPCYFDKIITDDIQIEQPGE